MSALGPIDSLMSNVTSHLQDVGIDIKDMESDHVCFRCGTVAEYREVKKQLELDGATQLVESMIGGRSGTPIAHTGFSAPELSRSWSVEATPATTTALTLPLLHGLDRPISTYLLHAPLCWNGRKIRCVEVPCPKPGRAYESGWEHVEFVVPNPASRSAYTVWGND